MFGIGTLINTAAVILGGIIGILLRKGLKENIRKTLMAACGIATIFIGVAGTLEGMIIIKDGKIETQGAMLLIFSLVIGGFFGELIDIEKGMDILGERLKKTFSRENDSRFAEGFVNSSLIICIGAMAIVGSIEDGLTGDFSMLAAKSVLDFVVVMILASSYGAGTAFSALAVFVYEGALTVAAHFAGNFISDEIVNSLSYIGSALIFCVGINITFGKKIRVGNFLPALLIPVIYIYIKALL